MQYIKGIDAFREEKRTAVTLGKFDGLHRGHQKLIEKIRSSVLYVHLICREAV